MAKYLVIVLLVVVALAFLPQETSQSRSIRSVQHDNSGDGHQAGGHHDGDGHVNHAAGDRHYLSKRYAGDDHDEHDGHSGHNSHDSGDHGNGGGHGHDSDSHGHH